MRPIFRLHGVLVFVWVIWAGATLESHPFGHTLAVIVSALLLLFTLASIILMGIEEFLERLTRVKSAFDSCFAYVDRRFGPNRERRNSERRRFIPRVITFTPKTRIGMYEGDPVVLPNIRLIYVPGVGGTPGQIIPDRRHQERRQPAALSKICA